MKTWIKRILISLVVFIVVAVVGLAIFLLTFDPNAYKDKLAELIQDRYQRTLTIDGPIELSLFPRIGLSLQDVALSEPGSDRVFASMESARVAVAVFPLLSDNLVVDHVAVSGFKGRFVRLKDGSFNFDDLVQGPSGQPPVVDGNGVVLDPQSGAGLRLAGGHQGSGFQIDIAGLDLQEGELLLQDEMSGRAVALNELNINTGRVTFNQAFNATVTAHIEGGNPRMDAQFTGQGLFTLDPAARRYAARNLDIRVNGQLPGVQAKTLTARGNVAFNGAESALDVSGLEVLLQGAVTYARLPVTGLDVSVVVPKLSAHPNKSQLQLERLTVRATGGMADGPFELALDAPALNISPDSAKGQALTGRLRMTGPNTLDARFTLAGISGNASELDISEATLDGSLKMGERLIKASASTPIGLDLNQRSIAMSALRGDVSITDPGLPKGSLQIPIIGSLGADLNADQASANINAVLEGGKFDLSTQVTQLSQTPKVAFNLAVDILDLDKLAPPPSARAAPVAEAPKDTSGAYAAPATAAVAQSTINLSALVGPHAAGSLKIGRLVMRNIKAQDVVASVDLQQGKLDISGLMANLYEGKLSGNISVDAARNNLTVAKLALSGVAIEPMLADASGASVLKGRGDFTLDLTTAGANSYALRRALNGTVSGRLHDGAIKGINVARTLRELKAVVQRTQAVQTLAPDVTTAVATEGLAAAANQAVAAVAAGAQRGDAPQPGSAGAASPAAQAGKITQDENAVQAKAVEASKAAVAAKAEAVEVQAAKVQAAKTKAAKAAGGGQQTVTDAAGPVAEQTPAAPAVQAAAGAPARTSSELSTDFTSLETAFSFKDGQGTITNLNIASPFLRITQGKPATINLVDSTLDIVTLIRVVNTSKGQGAEDLAGLKNITIPVQFAGPLSRPLYSVQWRHVTSDALKQKLEDKVMDAIGKSGAGRTERRQAVRNARDALKGLMK